MFEQQDVDLRVLRLPVSDDPDTFLRKNGADAFSTELDHAMSLIDYRIESATARYSNQDEASLPALIKEVLPILMEIRRPIVLDAQIVKVAQHWSRGDLTRARAIEAAIKQELTLVRRRPAHASSETATEAEAEASPSLASPRVPGVVRSERQLLAIALGRLDVARKVLQDVTPDEFVDPLNRKIAKRVYEIASASSESEIGEQLAREIVEEFGQSDPDAAAVVTQMFMDDHPVDDRQIAKVVQAVKDRHDRKKRTSLSRDRLYGCASPGVR
jgi:DNA primase